MLFQNLRITIMLGSVGLTAHLILGSAAAQTPPLQNIVPCSTQAHQQFDFWVGEWKVTDPNGMHVGNNTLRKIQNGCAMQEKWRASTSPFTGTSFNFFNAGTEKWEQLWLDNQGGNLHMTGTRLGNQMILKTAVSKNSQGKDTYNQVTWTKNEDGSVRQEWLVITQGQDNQVAFDGRYQRVEPVLEN